MTQLRVRETHTPSEEGEGRADFRGLAFTPHERGGGGQVGKGGRRDTVRARELRPDQR
jgi:hypothetical protein